MNERIGFICENSVDYVSKIVDVWNNGNAAVLIDPKIPIRQQIVMLKNANVKMCYVDNMKINDKLNENGFLIKWIRCDNRFKKVPEKVYEKFIENTSEEEAVILFSSGTTGIAKGCILSFRAILTNAHAITKYMKITNDKKQKVGIFKSLCHSSTLIGEMLVCLVGKIDLYIGKITYSPNANWKRIIDNKITHICLNPTLLKLLINAGPKQKMILW